MHTVDRRAATPSRLRQSATRLARPLPFPRLVAFVVERNRRRSQSPMPKVNARSASYFSCSFFLSSMVQRFTFIFDMVEHTDVNPVNQKVGPESPITFRLD